MRTTGTGPATSGPSCTGPCTWPPRTAAPSCSRWRPGPFLGALLWAVLPGGTLGPAAQGDVESGAPQAAVFAFFLAMTITWLAAAGAAREVVKERHILHRELGVGVSLATWLTGKAVFLSAASSSSWSRRSRPAATP